MHKVPVFAELSDEHYRAYEAEAKRRGVSVEELVQHTVNALLRDPISISASPSRRPLRLGLPPSGQRGRLLPAHWPFLPSSTIGRSSARRIALAPGSRDIVWLSADGH
jgi:hypothetical protein